MFSRKIAFMQNRIRDRDPHRDAVKAIRRLNRRQLVAAINSYYWWHSIDLGEGVTTPGQKSIELMQLEFANTFSKVDLKSKSVLDIGAWNGGFSVEAVRRGADRVVALDHYTWAHEFFKGRETFELVCRIADMDIDAVDIDLDDPQLSLSHLGQFDVILFLGVFYHLRNPLAALGQLALLTRELLIVETHIEHTADPRPLMVFYPGAELAGDATNWWGPNAACMIALLQALGFSRIEALPGSDPNRQIFHAYRVA